MTERPWRIVFFSQVQRAVARLTAIAQELGHEPVALLTPPPGPDGRERFAELVADAPAGLDVVVVPSKERLAHYTRLLEPDLVFCAGFPWLIPQELIDIPRLGIVNSHPSFLPQYRGPLPVAWTFRNGDDRIGMTYHLMDAGFDTGPVLAQATRPLGDDEWLDDLPPKLGAMSEELVPRVFERLAAGDRGDAQDEAAASYAPFFDDDYVAVDWSRPRRELHNQVRAWDAALPVRDRGPVTELDGARVRLTRTSLTPVPGAREVEAGDGPLWIVAHEQG